MPLSRVLDIDVAAPPTQPSGARMRAAEPSSGDVFAHPLIPVMTGVAVAVLAAVSIGWAHSLGLISGLWGVCGVAVAVWLRTGRGRRHDVAFATVLMISILIGELIAGYKPMLSLLFALANMVEIIGAVLLARRFAPTLNVSSLNGVRGFSFAPRLSRRSRRACSRRSPWRRSVRATCWKRFRPGGSVMRWAWPS